MNRVLEPFHERLKVPEALTKTLRIIRLRRRAGSRKAGDALS
jgi:hypothetical protein